MYVDKTRYIAKVFEKRGTSQLLIRPHLFLNTFQDVLLSKRELFKNTYIEQMNHDWKKYTVIKIECLPDSPLDSFRSNIVRMAEEYKVKFPRDEPIQSTSPLYFSNVVSELAEVKWMGNIALLVDEYDLSLLTAGSDLVEYYKIFLRSLRSLL